ncbi:GNAT family N-acetyltransferase [Pseudoalteromonas umbrosa]|uniref:GNAT family N-acetyltransferase n=1 Tax=Pseudoalteromonas umbrosa TaxID=3048489 RepID=UPI0024C2A959|nr:GNAT family N-acetyltransferase [Pseudoalteromonas sp. B95]MDK1287650.1 GNAT family N-acetyltransferase [Pseudoalteromonas sp. B95]
MHFNFSVDNIQNIHETARLVVATFNEREPLAEANNAPPKEFAEFILGLTQHCADNGLGFIARELTTNKIIGAILTSDLAETLNKIDTDDKEPSNPIATLITALNNSYFKGETLLNNIYLSIKFVATDDRFKGNGVADKLISECISEAKNKGFKYAQAEANGNVSQHIFKNKLGFEEKAFIKYREFTLGDEKPFSEITEHEGIKLLIKRI